VVLNELEALGPNFAAALEFARTSCEVVETEGDSAADAIQRLIGECFWSGMPQAFCAKDPSTPNQ
jgi:hypothetical protein